MAHTVRRLDACAYPAICDRQLDEVRPGDVLAVIKSRAHTAVTAWRIRVIVQQICSHAIRDLLVTMNPAPPLPGAIASPRTPAMVAWHALPARMPGICVSSMSYGRGALRLLHCSGQPLHARSLAREQRHASDRSAVDAVPTPFIQQFGYDRTSNRKDRCRRPSDAEPRLSIRQERPMAPQRSQGRSATALLKR